MEKNQDTDLIHTQEITNDLTEPVTPQVIEEPPINNAINHYAGTAVKNVQEQLTQGDTGNFKEGSKNIAHIVTTAAALDATDEDNRKFLDQIKKDKQGELAESFKGERLKEEAKKLSAKRQKAEEFYNNFRPILEFDFSHLIPKHRKTKLFNKKDKKGNIITTDEEEPIITPTQKPTYQDRSYGIPLMVLMLCILTAPYCLITALLAIFTGINALFDGIARFGKPALIICGTLVVIVIMLLSVYGFCVGIDKLFGTQIIATIIK